MPRTGSKTNQTEPVLGDTPQALMRQRHPGKWLAWSLDEKHILAVGDTTEAVRTAALQAGHKQFVYDWVPPADARQTTGLQ
jgi:hypothetical protein